MNQKRIYLSAEKWWEEKKKILDADLTNAKKFIADQETIRLMQELLKRTKVNLIDKGE